MKRLIAICAFTAMLVAIMMTMPGVSALWANTESVINHESMMDKERVIRFEELPVGAQKIIKTHFTTADIAIIIEEIDFPDKSYTVSYKNRTKIEFNKKGEWTEVKCPSEGVPAAIVPQKIASYVKENFPGAKIISIEMDHYPQEYDVKLDNRVSIEFNSRLEVIEIDL